MRYPLKLKGRRACKPHHSRHNDAQEDTRYRLRVARAIVNYGKRLGGYVAVGQLLELDGFPEEALPYFSVVHPHTEKLNLNTLTLAQLRRHP